MNTVNDTARLITDVQVIVESLCPKIDVKKLALRLEEIMGNYKIKRKSYHESTLDITEKMDMFIAAKKLEGYSVNTLNGYKQEINLFSVEVKKAVVQVTTADIRKYLASDETLKMSTIGKKLSVLKSFFGWMVKEEVLLRDPTAKINTPKTPKRLPKGLSIEQLEIVRESCESQRERALVEVLYSTGCRLNEIANLKISEVNFQSMNATVIGKGDKERIVHLSFKAMYHLKQYLKTRSDKCGYLFSTVRRPIRKMSNASIQREIRKIEKRTNIDKKITPHTFRHTLATNMLNNGADLADVQHILGHEDPSTTLDYAQVSEERKERAFKQFHVQ